MIMAVSGFKTLTAIISLLPFVKLVFLPNNGGYNLAGSAMVAVFA